MNKRPDNYHEGLVREYRESFLGKNRFCLEKGIPIGLLEYAICKAEKKEGKEKIPSFALVGKSRTEISVRSCELVRILREAQ